MGRMRLAADGGTNRRAQWSIFPILLYAYGFARIPAALGEYLADLSARFGVGKMV